MLAVRTALLSQGPPDSRASLGVDARQWSDAVIQTLRAPRVIPGLRIPDAEGYLADLARGRAAVLQGEPARSALQGVARAWNDRSQRRGVKRQLWHYRRSLNSLTTTPEPPAP
jgi:multiple sugar transport system substrate-binding protein